MYYFIVHDTFIRFVHHSGACRKPSSKRLTARLHKLVSAQHLKQFPCTIPSCLAASTTALRLHLQHLFRQLSSRPLNLLQTGLRLLELGPALLPVVVALAAKRENLNFYPSQSEIFVLTATQKQAITALTSKCCNYAKLEPKLENLKDFDDGEIDIVVGTSALCRCRDQTKLLREIYRVLSVGGKYYFIEHTNNGSLDPFSFFVKQILSMLGKFWFFDMCLLYSDPYNLIIEAGFKEVHCENTVIKSNINLLQLIENHIIGTAIK